VYALLAGNYKSPFRGSGMQFKEFRHYEAGDDIRHMSWSVTARTGRATMKLYEEERELNVMLLVDVSGSSLFGQARLRKIDMYAELLATLGLAAVKSGDNFGVMFFNDKPTYYIPPRRTREQVQLALKKLGEEKLGGKHSDVRPALNYLQASLKSRALIILISDFLLPSFEREVRMVCRRHELLLAHCFDDVERGGAIRGVYEVCDPETGEFSLLDANSPRTRFALATHHRQLVAQLRGLCDGSRAEYLPLSLEDDYLQKLVRFFRNRGTRRR
jgi:uncharacterized protein (DUF58 family)